MKTTLVSQKLFGKIDEDNFSKSKVGSLKYPLFEKAVSYNKYGDKMLESRATVVIGDPLYKQWGDLAQRIYESIKVGNVVLIDSSYDFLRRVFKSPELVNFNYVSNRQEVEHRLKMLKDNEFRRHIVNLQRDDMQFNLEDYCERLIRILEDN